MGVFDFFKAKGTQRNEKEIHFLEEVRLATIKYFGSSSAKLNLKDKKGKPTDFINSFPEVYQKCITIKSPWDRRSLIFSTLDQLFANQIPPFLYANRLIEDRYAQKAIEVLDKTGEPVDNKHLYYTVYANALTVLGSYSDAIEKAKIALDSSPAYLKAKVILADAYHLGGKTNEAHEIYNPLLNQFLDEQIDKSNGNINIIELFGAEFERVRSPILVIQFLKENSLPEDAWKWAEDEFYYSPYFRCQHAYWLLEKKKELLPAFSKLLALVKEMPWVKEAAINTMILFEKIDSSGEKGIASEDRMILKTLIEKNGWSSTGLHTMSINI